MRKTERTSSGRRGPSREDGILNSAAELFDLPPDVVAGLPRVELLGGRQLWLEGHRGLLSYSQERIDVNTPSGVLCVLGKDLTLLAMTPDALRIGGKLRALSWEDGDTPHTGPERDS